MIITGGLKSVTAAGGKPLVRIKSLFFDRAAVERRLNKDTLKLLRKVGARTRLRARSKIRPAPKKRRKGGKRPPYNRTGKQKNNIFFSLDPQADSVVTGPILFSGSRTGGSKTVPELLEYGGMATNQRTGRAAYYDEFPYMTPAHGEVLGEVPRFLADMVK